MPSPVVVVGEVVVIMAGMVAGSVVMGLVEVVIASTRTPVVVVVC